MARSPNHVRIAISDPVQDAEDLVLTDKRFPPSLAGWKAARADCDAYASSPRAADNFVAWPVLVVPTEDDRLLQTLRRIVAAAWQYRTQPDETTERNLDAELAKALICIPVLQQP